MAQRIAKQLLGHSLTSISSPSFKWWVAAVRSNHHFEDLSNEFANQCRPPIGLRVAESETNRYALTCADGKRKRFSFLSVHMLMTSPSDVIKVSRAKRRFRLADW